MMDNVVSQRADQLPFGPAYGFSLYVHWPYCSRICPYCDFNVYTHKDQNYDHLVDAICLDIQSHKEHLPSHGALDSVYLGGGTPSLLSPAQMHQILETAEKTFGYEEDIELTLEANPNDVLRSDVSDWARCGINRISVGLQSLSDAALVFLGRDHDAEAGRAAVERVRGHFKSVSVDLIYARPDQTAALWQAELTEALALDADHLSLYELTISPDTAFGLAVSRNKWAPLDENKQADLYEVTHKVTSAAGYPAYEVSNHAKDVGHRSVHNQTYWLGGDWIGVGPGAHGRLTIDGKRKATEAELKTNDYVSATAKHGVGYGRFDELSNKETARELLLMGLRTIDGMVASRIDNLTENPMNREKIRVFIERGWVRVGDGRIALTPTGWLLTDAIATELSS